MARIRTIKPEFWSSPGIETISPWARLLFIAMWNWADDAGRGTCQLRELQSFAFPLDEEAPVATMGGFRQALAEVRDQFGVVFYKVGGRPYYAIPSWKRHQRNERTAQSRFPAPEEGEPWDFMPPDRGSGGTSDMFRQSAAEVQSGAAEGRGSPPQTPAHAPSANGEAHPPSEGANAPDPGPQTALELGSGGTSDNLRHGAAEAPQTSGPGTGEQGNRGTGEQSCSGSGTDPASAADGEDLSPKNRGRDDAQRLCEHLQERIVANGSKKPTITNDWLNAARLLLDADGRTEEQVHAAIDWCQNDDFWMANIQSMPKLRKQYDTLRLQAQRKPSNVVPFASRQQQSDDLFDRAMARAREREAQMGIGDAQ
ncbi:hypothetical protein GCM10023224_05370 [Streptomonospora halophila]|uniref:Uncharacterized protein n=1 Tax=Streptomonospora halophila TaxID=427369 RepID=A0ABP9G517_9ACTN